MMLLMLAFCVSFDQKIALPQENPNILVAATTNHPDWIDDALIRTGRFDYKAYVPMPNEDGRREIVVNIMKRSIMSHEQEGFQVYGADIAEIIRRMQFSKAMQEAQSTEVTPILQEELVAAIRKFRTNG